MKKNTKYYLIWNRVVGKQDDEHSYIFQKGKWELDRDYLIMDRLVGYDPSEPPGSPYRFGNGSVMAEMDEITYEEAVKLTGGYA